VKIEGTEHKDLLKYR